MLKRLIVFLSSFIMILICCNCVTVSEAVEQKVTLPTRDDCYTNSGVIQAYGVTYTFSDYNAGVQFADETHQLDDNVRLQITGCHLTRQLRIYQNVANDGQAIFICANKIESVVINAGPSLGNAGLAILGSQDGMEWTEITTIDVSITYADYTVKMPEKSEYYYLKLDAVNAQVRVPYLSFVFTGANCSTSLPTEPEVTIPDAIIPSDVEKYFTYSIADGQATITYCDTSISGNVTVPNRLGNYPVTAIGSWAFAECDGLIGITIPDSITTIGEGAFYDCTNLTSITIPNSVISMGDWVFYNCSSLYSVVLPNSITTIPYSAFYYCTMLTDVTIPDSVVNIGFQAFCCTNLINVSIPYGVISIEGSAFSSCKNLCSVTIPNSVTSIGDGAFSYCESLKNITIPNSVTNIGEGIFSSCCNLLSVAIPDSITHISSSAFSHCNNLTKITIPSSVTSIGEYAFYSCNRLTSFTIPDGVAVIGSASFCDCISLTSLILNDSIISIGDSAFLNCNNLTDVYFCGSQQQWNDISMFAFNEPLTNATLHFHNCGEYTITLEPTFTTGGKKQKTCIICGDTITENIEALNGKVSTWNIVLEDDYAVNFYLQVSESIGNTAKVRLTIGNDTVTYNVSDLEKTEDGYFRLTANISAAQMNDFITVMVMNGRDIGSNNTYTAREYCDTILADSAYSQYHSLVKEMLNYGAMAQMYFDYETEYLANDGITGVAAAEVPETAEEMTVSDKISGVNFYGASLLYRDRIAVRYYFTGDVSGCVFNANGNTYTPIVKDGMYYVEIADILPQNLDQQITLTVTDANGNILTVTYGPMNYIVRMNIRGSEPLKNLLKALYNYHLASKAVCGEADTTYKVLVSGVWKMLKYSDGHLYDWIIDFRSTDDSPYFSVGIGDDITDELQQWLDWGAQLTEWDGRYYYFGRGDGGSIEYSIKDNLITVSSDVELCLTLESTAENYLTIISVTGNEYFLSQISVGDVLYLSTE